MNDTLPRRPIGPLLAALAAVVIAAIGFLLIRGVSPGQPVTGPTTVTATPTGPTGTTSPSTTATSTAPATEPTTAPLPPTSAPGLLTVPVYYGADTVAGPRLYREFRQVAPVSGRPIETAVTAMLSLPALDPDYTSFWPAATRVRSITRAGSVVTVDLSGYVTLGAAFESAALQQLVHTVTAADPTVTAIRLLVNGATPPSGHLDVSGPIVRAPALQTIANVWILSPGHGMSVTSPVTVGIYGTGFEGNVPIKVFKGTDEVASTFVTTMMGGFAEASAIVTLPPGTYEIRAYNDSGMDDSLQVWDTKTITVR
ncbi:MAG: GerMN domain-containing protein [Candidatus Phosphoribacter sp.]